jgi:hypothetical protein
MAKKKPAASVYVSPLNPDDPKDTEFKQLLVDRGWPKDKIKIVLALRQRAYGTD